MKTESPIPMIDASKKYNLWALVLNKSDALYDEANSYYNDYGTFTEFLQDISQDDEWPKDLYTILTANHMWLTTIMKKWDKVGEAFYKHCLLMSGAVIKEN